MIGSINEERKTWAALYLTMQRCCEYWCMELADRQTEENWIIEYIICMIEIYFNMRELVVSQRIGLWVNAKRKEIYASKEWKEAWSSVSWNLNRQRQRILKERRVRDEVYEIFGSMLLDNRIILHLNQDHLREAVSFKKYYVFQF